MPEKFLRGLGEDVDMLSLMLRRLGFEVIANCRRDAATSMFGRNRERPKQGVTTMIFDPTYADDGALDLCYDEFIEEIRDATRWQFGFFEKTDNRLSVTGPCRPIHLCTPPTRAARLKELGANLLCRLVNHIVRLSICA